MSYLITSRSCYLNTLLPLGLYGVYVFFTYAVLRSEPTYIDLNLWQLLPLPALEEHPWSSLWHLHSQPPMLNFLFWLVYAQQPLLGLDPRWGAVWLFAGFGLVNAWVWFQLALRLFGSRKLAVLLVTLILINPGYRLNEKFFFYPLLEMTGVGTWLWLVLRWIERPCARRFCVAMLPLLFLVFTRSLYMPLWSLIFAIYAAFILRRRGWSARATVRQLGCGLILFWAVAAPWMIKNKVLYNFAGFSSWAGLNLRIDLSDAICPIWRFANDGHYDPALVNAFYSPQQLARFEQVPALTILTKPLTGQNVNLNHFAVPALSAYSLRHAADYIRKFPRTYTDYFITNWQAFDLPAYVQMYSLDFKTGQYKLILNSDWPRLFDRVYYGSWLKRYATFKTNNGQIRISFYMLVLMPLGLWGSIRRLRKAWRAPTVADAAIHRYALFALMLLIYGWLFIMITLVDGAESARMRWHLEPMFLLMLVAGIFEVALILRGYGDRLKRRAVVAVADEIQRRTQQAAGSEVGPKPDSEAGLNQGGYVDRLKHQAIAAMADEFQRHTHQASGSEAEPKADPNSSKN